MLEYNKPKVISFRYLTAVSLVFLILGLVPTAHAGIGTSPGDEGKLRAVANDLVNINNRINMVLGLPPDPCIPGYNGALTDVCTASQAIVSTVDDAISQDNMSDELKEALSGVGDRAQSIVDLTSANQDQVPG